MALGKITDYQGPNSVQWSNWLSGIVKGGDQGRITKKQK